MNTDEQFLNLTFSLAKKGMGWVNPNPMVGAILVKKGRIIGKGYHKRVGLPHAEIETLKSCKTDPKGATLYVNLEPCVHFGKTPPCVDTIIQSGIKRVVFSTLDPNPKVHGQSFKKLQKTGLDINVGILENQARSLNEAFFTFHEKKRPFITIKFAASLDGKIATVTGSSKWITNEKARNYVRKLRSQYQAILVGINTVLKDDPNLGNSLRIILDSKLRIPMDAQVLRDHNVILITTTKADKLKKKQLDKRGIPVIVFDGSIMIPELLSELGQKEIISILIEGGEHVLGSFVDAKVVDKVYIFHAPILIGGKNAKNAIGGQGIQNIAQAVHLKNLSYRRFDDNLLTIGYVV